jgi:hypothetical protein
LAVSKPVPVFAPVTITTLPDKSGISSIENLDFDGKLCLAAVMMDIKDGHCVPWVRKKTCRTIITTENHGMIGFEARISELLRMNRLLR